MRPPSVGETEQVSGSQHDVTAAFRANRVDRDAVIEAYLEIRDRFDAPIFDSGRISGLGTSLAALDFCQQVLAVAVRRRKLSHLEALTHIDGALDIGRRRLGERITSEFKVNLSGIARQNQRQNRESRVLDNLDSSKERNYGDWHQAFITHSPKWANPDLRVVAKLAEELTDYCYARRQAVALASKKLRVVGLDLDPVYARIEGRRYARAFSLKEFLRQAAEQQGRTKAKAA